MEQDTRISKETVELCKAKGFPHFFSSGYETWQATQTSIQKWLREVHFLDIEPEKYRHDKTGRYYKVRIWGSEMSNEGYLTGFNSYEEALEQGLITALNLIEDERTQ